MAVVLSNPMGQAFAPGAKRPQNDAASVYAPSMYSTSSADTRSLNYAQRAPYAAAPPGTLPVRGRQGPEFKTLHTYTGATGKLLVQLQTPPQALPTYMGGSKERGCGAVVGRVILHCTDKDRANEVRIKLKAAVSVLVPKASQATDGDMPTFSGLSPATISTSSREQVLVQLDHRLKAADAQYRVSQEAAPQANTAGRLDKNGIYEWTFVFDIPEKGSGKNTLPMGFPGTGSHYPSSYVLESDVKRSGTVEEWASVKWYIKVTIERPGIFRSNDRLLVPFIYLPPPPDAISDVLVQRQALSMQIQRMVHAVHGTVVLPKTLVEPPSKWLTEYFPLSQATLGQTTKRTFVDKLFGMNKPKEERWAISLPGKPFPVFPLRATIPFMLTLVHSAGMPLVVHPHVFLVQKVHLRARASAAHTQYIWHAKVLPSPATKTGMQQWFGWIQFPSSCSPTFDTQHLGLEYFVQVKPLNTPGAQVLRSIPIGLYCAPPRLAQVRERARDQALARLPRPAPGSPRAPSVLSNNSMAPLRRPMDTMSIASTDTAHRLSPSSGTVPRPFSVQGSPQSSRRGSVASVGRVAPSAHSGSHQRLAMGVATPLDPAMAGVAGIGRAHLPGAAPHTPASRAPTPPPAPAAGAQTPALLSSPGPASDLGMDTETLQNPYDPRTPPRLPERPSMPASALSSPGREPSMPQAPAQGGPPPEDTGIHDAGPLTAEQEQAWTMDILANAFDDDDGDAFELPPSYFEATGIQDNDE